MQSFNLIIETSINTKHDELIRTIAYTTIHQLIDSMEYELNEKISIQSDHFLAVTRLIELNKYSLRVLIDVRFDKEDFDLIKKTLDFWLNELKEDELINQFSHLLIKRNGG